VLAGETATAAADADTPIADADAVRIGVVTLGCDKNTVDSERMLGRLVGAGASVQSGVRGADVAVINTCGFIDMAKEESVDAILDAVRLKRDGMIRAVVAVGCLVQRYKQELLAEIPEVDLFLGLTEADSLVPALRAKGLLPPAGRISTMERPLRVLTSSRPFSSYLKISEGCDHACAFCAIPLMRGRHRSTPIDVLVREAKQLEMSGVVELNIVSQDTTWYGRDRMRLAAAAQSRANASPVGFARDAEPAVVAGHGLDDTGNYYIGRPFARMKGDVHGAATRDVLRPEQRIGLLPDLLRALLAETSVPWLRLFYMYPSGITRELVELMASEPRLLAYLDIPIQHGSDTVLKRMRRPERRRTIRERVAWLRAAIPDLTLRTTVIVGFPGETDTEFDELLELLEEVRFDRLGAFAYSTEEDTAAAQMPGQIAEEIKRERLDRLHDLQRGISQERNERWIGRHVDAFVERTAGWDSDRAESCGAVCRSAAQAPDVDGVIHLADAAGAKPGELITVRITDAVEDDLLGERVGAT
jgi:ribosomal protein S12 methylthiotransferase